MKHNWENIHGRVQEDMSNNGRRRCQNCGKEQTKHSKQEWMRIIGYYWEPKVGRCDSPQDESKRNF